MTLRTTKIVSMVNCKLDLNAIMADNSAGGSPALLFVYLFYHQLFVTGVTKTSKTGLSLFLSSGSLLRFSKSETDPRCQQKKGRCTQRNDPSFIKVSILQPRGYGTAVQMGESSL